MFESFLSIMYYAIALFYLTYGIGLLLFPRAVLSHIPRFFPLLASFRYHTLANSLNLVGVGSLLLIIAKYIDSPSPTAIFVALVLSGLEVYLGVQFYYLEERDIPQAIVHVVLHTVVVAIIGWLLLTEYSDTLSTFRMEALAIFGVY